MKLSKKMKGIIISAVVLLGVSSVSEISSNVLADKNDDANANSTFVIKTNSTLKKENSSNFFSESKIALPYVTNPDWGAPMGNSEMWDKFYDPNYKPGGGSPKRHKSSTKHSKKNNHK